MNLQPSTRLAIQAATAVLIACLFGLFFDFARSYWAILTAVFLIAQTFGESITKSLDRVFATILGGIVGTALYMLFAHYPIVLILLALITMFCLTYILSASYSVGVFFITVFVVFLFAAVGNWSLSILEARIIETCVGAGIAIITTAIIFPIRAKHQVNDHLINFLEEIGNSLQQAFEHILNRTTYRSEASMKKLFKIYADLQTHYQALQYETLFQARSQRHMQNIMFHFQILFHYATSVSELASNIHNTDKLSLIRSDLTEFSTALKENIQIINQKLRQEKSEKAFISLIPARDRIRAKVIQSLEQGDTTKRDWFYTFPFVFTARKTNECLHDIDKLLS